MHTVNLKMRNPYLVDQNKKEGSRKHFLEDIYPSIDYPIL